MPHMKYLVTGGAGFIGSHLCDALLARGDTVRVVDDLSTGKRENLQPDVELIVGDVADPAIMRAAVQGVAGCFHLAAVASVQASLTDLVGTHRTNQTGFVTLLDALSRLPERPPVVYASSAAVYGRVAPPLSESAPTRPLSAYGVDKLGCELHADVANQVHRIPTVGLRFFNVYGPRQDPSSPYSGVISVFCDRLRQQTPITIHGDGTQTRDFIYVTDVVAALLAAADGASRFPGVYNVCTGRATSVMELATIIASIAGVRPTIVHGPARTGDIRHSSGSPAALWETFHLGKPVRLKHGLARLLRSMQT